MSTTTAAYLNASGHFQQATITTPEGSAVTDSALIAGNVVYEESTGHVALNTGATDAIVAAITGIADGTYASTATASFFKAGQDATGLSGLTAGTEYFAKQDGTLDIYANVSSGSWTRSMGVALSATSLRVRLGEVVQHP